MFTGIVQGIAQVKEVHSYAGGKKVNIFFGSEGVDGLKIGASVAIDGVCLTAVDVQKEAAAFEIIQETLSCTTLQDLVPGRCVNWERSAKFGDEIGGHLLSGHVFAVASIEKIETPPNNTIMTFNGEPRWMKYIFPKGYVAIDGASLTVVDVYPGSTFTVHLIPETLRATTLGKKSVGDLVNIEIDAQIQAIVNTIERIDGRSDLYNRPA